MSITRARTLRVWQAEAEKKLWYALRDRQLGTKFRRQEPFGPYVLDFVSFEHKLVIEADGGQHAERVREDAIRTAFLEREGFRVLRFWNNDVLGNLPGVLERIAQVLTNPSQPLALYVHWPFCKAKCPYCDFNSHVRESVEHERWAAALVRELDHYAEQTAGRRLTSIFFGGGTPSLMRPATVAAVIERANQRFTFDESIEITLEANPTSAEAGAFAGFAAAGVNRLSLGVQALDEPSLRFLGRQHSAAEALAAVALARRAVPRISFDLIYARPEQTPEAWAAELTRALAEGAEHLSLYQLTIEENTVFYGMARRGELQTLPEEAQAGLFEATQETLTAAGLPAYEISNHARPGAESRHNLTYWRYGDYLGIGPGAHGRLTLDDGKWALRQHRAPEAWLATVERDGHATRTRDGLAPGDRLQELLLMGLRLAEGVPLERVQRETGRALGAQIAPERLSALIGEGYLTLTDERLTATAEGRQRLDALLAHLLA